MTATHLLHNYNIIMGKVIGRLERNAGASVGYPKYILLEVALSAYKASRGSKRAALSPAKLKLESPTSREEGDAL